MVCWHKLTRRNNAQVLIDFISTAFSYIKDRMPSRFLDENLDLLKLSFVMAATGKKNRVSKIRDWALNATSGEGNPELSGRSVPPYARHHR